MEHPAGGEWGGALNDLVRVPLKNWNGIEVGRIEAAEALRALS